MRALRTALIRSVIAGLTLALALAVFSLLRGESQAETLRYTLSGLIVALGAVVPVTLVEGWLSAPARAERRGALGAFFLLYLASLLGWLITLAQLGYVYALVDQRALTEAFAASLRFLQRAERLYALHLALPVSCALASLNALGRLPRGPRALGLTVVAVVCPLLGSTLWPSLGAFGVVPLLVVGVSVVLSGLFFLARPLEESIWKSSAERPAAFEVAEPSGPPSLALLLVGGGGPGFAFGSLAYLGAGAALVVLKLGSVWQVVWGVGLLWFLHLLLAVNLPSVLLRLGLHGQALDAARRILGAHARRTVPATQGSLRLYREIEVRALLALGRKEEALSLLPQALSEGQSSVEHLRRLRLGRELLSAGCPRAAIETVAPVPRERGKVMDLEALAVSVESVGLGALGQPEEALRLTRALLEREGPLVKRMRAILLNNAAIFLLMQEEAEDARGEGAAGDGASAGVEERGAGEAPLSNAQRALAWSEEALSLWPGHPFFPGTRGAALLAAGDAAEALPLLLAHSEHPALSPNGRAWRHYLLGRCHEALGREAQAQQAFTRAAEEDPESVPAARAARRMGPSATESDAGPDR